MVVTQSDKNETLSLEEPSESVITDRGFKATHIGAVGIFDRPKVLSYREYTALLHSGQADNYLDNFFRGRGIVSTVKIRV